MSSFEFRLSTGHYVIQYNCGEKKKKLMHELKVCSIHAIKIK